MLINLQIQITILLLILFAPFSSASVVEGLFLSSVEVQSKQNTDRQLAFNDALMKTLLKLTGDQSLINSPNISAHFFPAERFVQSFSYEDNSDYLDYLALQKTEPENASLESSNLESSSLESANTEEASISVDDTKIPLPFILNADFSSTAIIEEMKLLGLPVWGNVRPNIMIWGLVEAQGQRDMFGLENDHDVMSLLNTSAMRYGLPLSFPNADEKDKATISMSDLWGLFPDAISKAKQRYNANGTVMVRFYQSLSGLWSANWFFELNELAYAGAIKNVPLNEASEALIGFVSKILSQRFSVQAGSSISESEKLYLEISNINTFNDYVQVRQFLSELGAVESLSIIWIKGEIMRLLAELNSSPSQFNEYLNLSGKLKYISSSTLTDSLPQPLDSQNVAADVGLNLPQGAEGRSIQINSELPNKTLSTPLSVDLIQHYKWLPSSDSETQ